MKLTTTPVKVLSACALVCAGQAVAKEGAPHSVAVDVNYTDVTISWCAPQSAKELKWHDGQNYNGDYAAAADNQGFAKCYAGARFTAADLKNCVGEKVTAIVYSMYRPLVAAKVLVYENGVVVGQGQADMDAYVRDEMQSVALDEAVEIKADAEYLFAVEYTYGSNMDFIAIKDSATNAPGKGDLFSTDGVNWSATGAGDYLVTAILENDVDEEPVSYDVFCGSEKLTAEAITDLTASFSNQKQGINEYTVKANYANNSYESKSVSAEISDFSSVLPSPNFNSSSVSGLNVELNWTAPNVGSDDLTWSPNGVLSYVIGGTASKNTKVWIRNQFAASDLWAYEGCSINSVSTQFASEGDVTDVTVWVQKDGSFVYAEAASADIIASIKANEWVTFPISSPVAIEAGHQYSYGLYVLHASGAHPISVSDSPTVNVKGNSFSVSSASSTFTNTKPTWKTLRAGNMEGNWLMKAGLEGTPKSLENYTYTLERDGQAIASGISDLSVQDVVDAPGTYTYSVYIVNGDQKSFADETSVSVALPDEYVAPLLTEGTFDEVTKDLNIGWSMDKSLAKCGDAAYYGGFDEEMTMMWGAQFSADELAAYKGQQIKQLKFAVGEQFGDFKVGVYTTSGTALSELSFEKADIDELTYYTCEIDPVTITGEQDLILAYSGTIPAGANAMLFDAGPNVDGGARVSLTGGASWMNLGTINSTFKDVNIIISGVVGNASSDASEARELVKTKSLNKNSLSEGLGVEAQGTLVRRAKAQAEAPVVDHFKVYHNGECVAETKGYSYSENVSRYASHSYSVSAVYSNGWESAKTSEFSFTNSIAQKAQAPYGLAGSVADGDITLSWQSPDQAKVLSYLTDTSVANAVGMTTSNPTSYAVVKFAAEDNAEIVGKKIDHIQFYLAAEVNSLSVVVLYNDNIIYKQAVSDFVVGLNDVRLNEPVEVPAGFDFSLGYVAQYSTGVKPLGLENGAAKAGYGDLISSSATPGYWYSLQTKFKIDHNWWITATLAAEDSEIYVKAPAKDAAATTYNVYHDGSLIAEGLTETEYKCEAKNGSYYVTAVDAEGVESGESNKIEVYGLSGVANIAADAVAADVEYFNLQGVSVNKANLAPGVYIRRQGDKAAKVLVK